MMGKNEEGIIDGGKKIGRKKDHRDRWGESLREREKGQEREREKKRQERDEAREERGMNV